MYENCKNFRRLIIQLHTFNKHVVASPLITVRWENDLASADRKELGCFHIIFAQILTAHNFCLTRITASILIYANALGYFLSIKVEFVMRNMISICLCCCIWEGGYKKCNFQKIEEDKLNCLFLAQYHLNLLTYKPDYNFS